MSRTLSEFTNKANVMNFHRAWQHLANRNGTVPGEMLALSQWFSHKST
jgi:hypothetical protein